MDHQQLEMSQMILGENVCLRRFGGSQLTFLLIIIWLFSLAIVIMLALLLIKCYSK